MANETTPLRIRIPTELLREIELHAHVEQETPRDLVVEAVKSELGKRCSENGPEYYAALGALRRYVDRAPAAAEEDG